MILNRAGPSVEPWGTPLMTSWAELNSPPPPRPSHPARFIPSEECTHPSCEQLPCLAGCSTFLAILVQQLARGLLISEFSQPVRGKVLPFQGLSAGSHQAYFQGQDLPFFCQPGTLIHSRGISWQTYEDCSLLPQVLHAPV